MSDTDLVLTTEERAIVKAREKAQATRERRRRFRRGLLVITVGANLIADIPAFVSIGMIGAVTAAGVATGLALVVWGLELAGAFDP